MRHLHTTQHIPGQCYKSIRCGSLSSVIKSGWTCESAMRHASGFGIREHLALAVILALHESRDKKKQLHSVHSCVLQVLFEIVFVFEVVLGFRV